MEAGRSPTARERRSPSPAKPAERDSLLKLETVCALAGASLFHAFSGVDLALERAGKALVERNGPNGEFELLYLSLPDCGVEPIFGDGARRPGTVGHANGLGDVLVDDGSYTSKARLLKKSGRDAVVFEPPADIGRDYWNPVLSDDGAMVWLVSRRVGDGIEMLLQVRNPVKGTERSIPLDTIRKQLMVLGANVAEDQFVLSAFPGTVYVVDGSGAVTWGPVETGVSLVAPDFRRIGGGWVAWESLEQNAFVRWSTTAGRGERKFPLVHIDAVSINPGETRVAIAASSGSRLNNEDVVSILSLPDGKEIFHQTLPRYTRARLSFLDDEQLAVSGGTSVEVYRVPSSMPTREGTAAKPINVEDRMVSQVRQVGEKLGLEPEDTTPQTAEELVGTWRLSDVTPGQGCGMDTPFVEIRADGKAYTPETGKPIGEVSIKPSHVQIAGGDMGGAMMIFPMSGDFYLPSFECLLLKLERSP